MVQSLPGFFSFALGVVWLGVIVAWLCATVYLFLLAVRLVRAVEQIADRF